MRGTVIERRLAREVLGGALAASEGADYDIVDSDGGKWEVRCVSKGGVYFCPSYMVGKGRKFEPLGFYQKLSEIQGYLLADIECFPRVPYWSVSGETVRTWWDQAHLGASTKILRKKALWLLEQV